MNHYPDSFWAASSRHQSNFAALQGDINTDVAIIGAGFTGLSAAYHLQQMGRECVVLDANAVGWGASGRNGGIAVPRYKLTFPELEQKYGLKTALHMYRMAHDAVDTLERITTDGALACDFGRYGHITPVVSDTDAARFTRDVEWLRKHAGDEHPRMLDRAQMARKVGTDFYSAGYYEPRGGAIHPLEYCQSLANVLAQRGVRIFCGTAVADWSARAQGVVLRTAQGSGKVHTLQGSGKVHTLQGSVRARTLLIAANGYSDISNAGRRLAKRVVPVASAVISTAVLSAALRARILPGGEPATDAKRLTNYYRVLRDGSFFFGGRGGASSRASQAIYDRLRRDMLAIFPMLEDVAISHQWFGLVAVTLDSLPHIGSLEPNVHYAMGYNGRGVALAALLGKHLAQLGTGQASELGPVSEGRFEPIPFHALRVPGKQIAISWKQFVDKLGL